jgi:ABC-2 type transport system permease protein
MRVYNQTIIAPTISALIFLSVFILAVGDTKHMIHGVKFINFIGYGLIIMSIVQNAFANSSSSLIMSKVLGYISDILMPPLSGVEIAFAYCAGAICRGIIVGVMVAISLVPFIDFNLYHPVLIIFFVIMPSLLLGLIGILTGMIAKSFEHNAAITSYIITPLSFLSGTFYSVDNLPSLLRYINYVNPFFYMIDGFRYSLTNHADSNIMVGAIMLITVNIFLFVIVSKLLQSGWRIKE